MRVSFMLKHGGFFRSRLKELVAVDSLSLKLHRHETLGLVGESGSGKTTFGQALVKLLTADGGEIFFDGEPIHARTRDQMRPLRTESEHLNTRAFIKDGRPDLIEKFAFRSMNPKRCIEQIERWKGQAAAYRSAETIDVEESHEYASSIMNSVWTANPRSSRHVRNNGCITSLPEKLRCQVPMSGRCFRHSADLHRHLPPQLTALIRTEHRRAGTDGAGPDDANREHLYHAAMMDPHTAAEPSDQIWSLVDDLPAADSDLHFRSGRGSKNSGCVSRGAHRSRPDRPTASAGSSCRRSSLASAGSLS